jgi:hypothetical protein
VLGSLAIGEKNGLHIRVPGVLAAVRTFGSQKDATRSLLMLLSGERDVVHVDFLGGSGTQSRIVTSSSAKTSHA